MISLKNIRYRTGSARLRSARASLIATALLLFAIVLAVPKLIWLCVGGFAVILFATYFTSRSGNVKKFRQMVERRQQRTWPRNAMKSIVEAFDIPAFILDRQGVLRYANRASVQAFGEANAGDPFSFKFRTPEISNLVDATIENNTRGFLNYVDNTTPQRWYNVECIPVPKIRNLKILSEPSKFFLLTFADISQIRKTDQMRSDFIANASHELRTPLSSIRGYIETLQGPANNDSQARDKFLGIMLGQAERMSRLIDDLLSLSNIEMKAHQPPCDEVDLSKVLKQTHSDLQPTAEKYGVDLQFSGVEQVMEIIGDHDELVQVFNNLVENACKYGKQKGVVEVSMDIAVFNADNKEAVRVVVQDEGAGIPENQVPRLTERFYRATGTEGKKPKGTGLGLAIVKHILARHGAGLEIDSTLGQGTSVTVTFNNIININ